MKESFSFDRDEQHELQSERADDGYKYEQAEMELQSLRGKLAATSPDDHFDIAKLKQDISIKEAELRLRRSIHENDDEQKPTLH